MLNFKKLISLVLIISSISLYSEAQVISKIEKARIASSRLDEIFHRKISKDILLSILKSISQNNGLDFSTVEQKDKSSILAFFYDNWNSICPFLYYIYIDY